MTEIIAIDKIELNRGQIVGLPKNPRFIRDERYESLKKSIAEAPEMLSLRELLVYPFEGKYVVIGGNMRLRACRELGYKEIPCKIIPEDTPVLKLREYTIKDNEGFGQYDWSIVQSDWDVEELRNWGVEDVDIHVAPEVNIDDFFSDISDENNSGAGEARGDLIITINIPSEIGGQYEEIKEQVSELMAQIDRNIKVQ